MISPRPDLEVDSSTAGDRAVLLARARAASSTTSPAGGRLRRAHPRAALRRRNSRRRDGEEQDDALIERLPVRLDADAGPSRSGGRPGAARRGTCRQVAAPADSAVPPMITAPMIGQLVAVPAFGDAGPFGRGDDDARRAPPHAGQQVDRGADRGRPGSGRAAPRRGCRRSRRRWLPNRVCASSQQTTKTTSRIMHRRAEDRPDPAVARGRIARETATRSATLPPVQM